VCLLHHRDLHAFPTRRSSDLGSISIRALGEDPNVVVMVDRLKLVNPDPQQLEKGTDGMIRMKDGQPLEADAAVRVTSGFLEASRSEEHTSELQSRENLVCRLL